jgi:hypothetical protein
VLTHNSPKQTIKDFLQAESVKKPRAAFCPMCGGTMVYQLVTFDFGDDESCDIQLPVCMKCGSK